MNKFILHTSDVVDFLTDCSDPDEAAEQYRAEMERRLDDQYNGQWEVELGQTNGMENYYYVDGYRMFGSSETLSLQEAHDDVAAQMVNDWSWLTVE